MDDTIKNIIVKVLEGTATHEEHVTLQNWMNHHPENAKTFADYESLWLALDIIANTNKFDVEDGYAGFVAKATPKQNQKSARSIYKYWKIAASILLLAGVSLLSYFTGKRSIECTVSYYEVNTPKGSKTQLTLPDGTKIWLNAGSKLIYPNKFIHNQREVSLEGEGYFEVAKDARHPFIVHTSDINIRVLGTVFNVKSYPGERTIETTLISGKVVIEGNQSNPGTTIKLAPNQKAIFLKKIGKLALSETEKKQITKLKSTTIDTEKISKIYVNENVKTVIYTSWKDNLMVFDNESFENIALKIERRYGAVIRFTDDKIKNYRFSGTFPEISIDRALNALQYASPFTYKIKGDSIFIGG
jgi:ferric-dicitrate binding protein FerR (iron transport regulator)